MSTPRRTRPLAGLAVLVLTGVLAAACGGGSGSTAADASTSSSAPASDWQSVLDEAKGQTVNWYLYGGDQRLNDFVDGEVTQRLADLGVTLNPVRIQDTADAVDKVLGEKQAGRTTGGSVDAIWINGENFATGVQADLWRCGWAAELPNSRYVDLTDPAVQSDFGVPVDGCEAAWQEADSALVYDSAALDPADVASVTSLLAWAQAHPGRLTYPAPPDFTGSMAVRTILYDTIGGPDRLPPAFDQQAYDAAAGRLWDRLRAIAPTLWRGGQTYPQSQDAVEKLYADGEISAFLTYGPGAVGPMVKDGVFPATTGEAVLAGGNISNVSNLAIPSNAADQAGALVLANVLEDPEVQLGLYRADGIYPAIDLSTLSAAQQQEFAGVATSPAVLTPAELSAHAVPELASGYLTHIEKDWVTEVLQQHP